MAYFARKLRYAAYDGDAGGGFMALIELAKKKGGRPVEFVLYRWAQYPNNERSEMIRLSAATAEEAIKRFWFLDEGTGKEFPGHESDRWKKTSFWLYSVAVGGSYERVSSGTWVRVGMPAPWKKRRKKRPLQLQFGNSAHILLVHYARLRGLEHEKLALEFDLIGIPGNETAYAQVQEQVEEIKEEIVSILATINSTKAEMRYRVYQMFPEIAGITPRRVLRKQHELRVHRCPATV